MTLATLDDTGPTGAICFDLPSPYEAHSCGLLHLPRFLAKIGKHLEGRLPKSYQKNFCRGFDRFLCMHLGVEPQAVVALVREYGLGTELNAPLLQLFPAKLRAVDWNRELIHKGMTEAGREFLAESLTNMGCANLIGSIVNVCDMIDLDEGRIPGFSDHLRIKWQPAS
jgi:hypothetical protein